MKNDVKRQNIKYKKYKKYLEKVLNWSLHLLVEIRHLSILVIQYATFSSFYVCECQIQLKGYNSGAIILLVYAKILTVKLQS